MIEKIGAIKKETVIFTSRSQGPGGQNVNRTNSAVQLRWSIPESSLFSDEQKQVLLLKLKNYLNSENELLIKCSETRDQKRNLTLAFEKLEKFLIAAFKKKKTRVKTKPTFSSKIKRLDSKRAHGEKKKNRSQSGFDN